MPGGPPYILGKSTQQNTYDIIVVGSGISGGWAAKEFCEKGLKVLMLERGRNIEHGDYPTATKNIWEFPHRLSLSLIHISEPTRLLSISYAVFCLKKKK